MQDKNGHNEAFYSIAKKSIPGPPLEDNFSSCCRSVDDTASMSSDWSMYDSPKSIKEVTAPPPNEVRFAKSNENKAEPRQLAKSTKPSELDETTHASSTRPPLYRSKDLIDPVSQFRHECIPETPKRSKAVLVDPETPKQREDFVLPFLEVSIERKEDETDSSPVEDVTEVNAVPAAEELDEPDRHHIRTLPSWSEQERAIVRLRAPKKMIITNSPISLKERLKAFQAKSPAPLVSA
jgi:hypothetical protein